MLLVWSWIELLCCLELPCCLVITDKKAPLPRYRQDDTYIGMQIMIAYNCNGVTSYVIIAYLTKPSAIS